MKRLHKNLLKLLKKENLFDSVLCIINNNDLADEKDKFVGYVVGEKDGKTIYREIHYLNKMNGFISNEEGETSPDELIGRINKPIQQERHTTTVLQLDFSIDDI